MAAILIMNAYITVKTKDYLYFAFTLAFLLACLVMVFTPVNSHGRIAFPSFIFGISLATLLLEQLGELRQKVHFTSFISICALVNYWSLLKGVLKKYG
jgi:uncharacterized membrane protein YhdT